MSARFRIPITAWIVGTTLLLAHLLTLGQYGIFRDEFYYLANGRHLAWGYVDHPPVVAVIAWLTEHTLGTSIYALRLPMLLVAVAVLAVMAGLVRRLGGGGLAVAFAWLAFALSPYYLFAFHYLSMNAPEVLWWCLSALLLFDATGGFALDADERQGTRAWLLFGLVMGIASLTKLSGLVWGAGLAVGLLLSPARRQIWKPWPWLAVALTALLFAPHVLWQVANDWPTAEFVRNAQANKIVPLAPVPFLAEQVTLLGPIGAFIGAIGLVAAFRRASVRPFAMAVVFSFVVFVLQRSKAYYVMPAYPILLVAGAVALEALLASRPVARRLAFAAMLIVGIPLVPLTLPVLPPATLQAYMARLGIGITSAERHEMGALPQHFADMFGWDSLADAVGRVVETLPTHERSTARIYAQNYGEAGALEYYGAPRGFPRIISGHNAYWHWGPGPGTVDVVIIVGGDVEDHRQVFDDVQVAGRAQCDLCMPYESDLPIYVARRPRVALGDVWSATKHFE